MSLLLRKITRSKWGECSSNRELPVNADALTNCLKTTGDTLSVWHAKDAADLVYAKIAMLGTLSRLEKIDFVVLQEDDLIAEKIRLENTPGITIATSLVNRHRDLSHLSVLEMSRVALLVQQILVDEKSERLGKAALKELLIRAVNEGLINPSDLNEDMRKALKP